MSDFLGSMYFWTLIFILIIFDGFCGSVTLIRKLGFGFWVLRLLFLGTIPCFGCVCRLMKGFLYYFLKILFSMHFFHFVFLFLLWWFFFFFGVIMFILWSVSVSLLENHI